MSVFDERVHVEETFVVDRIVMSDCCGVGVIYEDICSRCLEHCSPVVEEVCTNSGVF